jgi:hypothetical protein
MISLDLEAVGQLLPLPLDNVYLAGLLEGLTTLYNIIGCFPLWSIMYPTFLLVVPFGFWHVCWVPGCYGWFVVVSAIIAA